MSRPNLRPLRGQIYGLCERLPKFRLSEREKKPFRASYFCLFRRSPTIDRGNRIRQRINSMGSGLLPVYVRRLPATLANREPGINPDILGAIPALHRFCRSCQVIPSAYRRMIKHPAAALQPFHRCFVLHLLHCSASSHFISRNEYLNTHLEPPSGLVLVIFTGRYPA